MFTQSDAGQFKNCQNIVSGQIKSNLQLAKDNVVIQPLFRHRLIPLLSAPLFDNQAVQKGRHLQIRHPYIIGILLSFQPASELYTGYRQIGMTKHPDHFGITEIEGIAQAAENIVIVH